MFGRARTSHRPAEESRPPVTNRVHDVTLGPAGVATKRLFRRRYLVLNRAGSDVGLSLDDVEATVLLEAPPSRPQQYGEASVTWKSPAGSVQA